MAQASVASVEDWLPRSAQSVLEVLLLEPAELADRVRAAQDNSPNSTAPASRSGSRADSTRGYLA